MAYEPTVWKSGDVVTSAKLNKMENGIAAGGGLVVTDTGGTLDKTWQEIHDAMLSGGAAIQIGETGAATVLRAYESKGNYVVSSAEGVYYATSSASGYPVLNE